MTVRELPRLSPRLIAMMMAIAVVAGGIGYAWWASSPVSAEAQLRDVTTTIRCPVCIGESIADSTAPISIAMREETATRMSAGESPAQIREFFAQTYGPDVLLVPEVAGAGAAVWAVPVAIAAVVMVVAIGAIRARLERLRRERSDQTSSSPALPVARRAPVAVFGVAVVGLAVVVGAVLSSQGNDERSRARDLDHLHAAPGQASLNILAEAVGDQPADIGMRLAYATVLQAEGREHEAYQEFAAAYRLRPTDPDIAYLYAVALLQEGSVDEAGHTLDALLDLSPEHAPALLMRGLLLRQEGDAGAEDLLTRFLTVSPADSAAESVREMLEQDWG